MHAWVEEGLVRGFSLEALSAAAWGLEHRVLGAIRAIGVDEIQYGKGSQYLTRVYQIDLGCTRLLWIGKERTVRPSESSLP